MGSALDNLLQLLDLEALEVNLFRGQSTRPRGEGGLRWAGGQSGTGRRRAGPRNRFPHSLHAYFLRPGDMAHSIVYEVDRVRDGKRFTARRVQAIQGGEVLLSVDLLVPGPGGGAGASGPDAGRPAARVAAAPAGAGGSGSPRCRAFLRGSGRRFERRTAVEFRPVEPRNRSLPSVQPPAGVLGARQREAARRATPPRVCRSPMPRTSACSPRRCWPPGSRG